MIVLGVDVGVKVIDLRQRVYQLVGYTHPDYVQMCFDFFKRLVNTFHPRQEENTKQHKGIRSTDNKVDCVFGFLVGRLLMHSDVSFFLGSYIC